MNIHAVICTRSREDITKTTDKLLTFLSACKVKTYLITGAKSIFSAYYGAFKRIAPQPEDIMIFCHDDIEIRENPLTFVTNLKKALENEDSGFTGAAGTMELGPTAVWWDQDRWMQKLHRGKVIHLDESNKEYVTYYGKPGDVVVLDGLFLAAKPKVLDEVGLQKPEYFEGEWDFYDIHYTSQAFLKGYKNKVLEVNILHNSRGELVGRDSWHKNREAFIANTQLPLRLNP